MAKQPWSSGLGQFLGLAFRPFPGALNWVLSVVPVASVVAWIEGNPILSGAIALVGLLILFMVAGVRLQRHRDSSLRPGIRFGRTWVDKVGFVDAAGNATGHGWAAGGTIVNDPPGRLATQAVRNAYITLTIDQRSVITRWRESPQHVKRDPWEPKEVSKITLEPDGLEHQFDIVAKAFMRYEFSDDAPVDDEMSPEYRLQVMAKDSDAFVFVEPSWSLAPGSYEVGVVLRGVALSPDWIGTLTINLPNDLSPPAVEVMADAST